MATIEKEEIRPGLVVYQDPKILINFDDCLTNAAEENVVNRKGPFLVLDRHDENRWLCVPLYSLKDKKEDRVRLNSNLKGGHIKWLDRDSYFSVLQFWVIPEPAMVGASTGVEFQFVGRRNTYAEGDPGELASIAAYRDGSAVGYRHVSAIPTSA